LDSAAKKKKSQESDTPAGLENVAPRAFEKGKGLAGVGMKWPVFHHPLKKKSEGTMERNANVGNLAVN